MNDPNKHNVRAEVLNNLLSKFGAELGYWNAEKTLADFGGKYPSVYRVNYCKGAIKALNNMIEAIKEEVCK